ncbi:MAG: hypothetical protein Q8P90_01970 [bacterium]|nr:hypothetical protein [bacterium]
MPNIAPRRDARQAVRAYALSAGYQADEFALAETPIADNWIEVSAVMYEGGPTLSVRTEKYRAIITEHPNHLAHKPS